MMISMTVQEGRNMMISVTVQEGRSMMINITIIVIIAIVAIFILLGKRKSPSTTQSDKNTKNLEKLADFENKYPEKNILNFISIIYKGAFNQKTNGVTIISSTNDNRLFNLRVFHCTFLDSDFDNLIRQAYNTENDSFKRYMTDLYLDKIIKDFNLTGEEASLFGDKSDFYNAMQGAKDSSVITYYEDEYGLGLEMNLTSNNYKTIFENLKTVCKSKYPNAKIQYTGSIVFYIEF